MPNLDLRSLAFAAPLNYNAVQVAVGVPRPSPYKWAGASRAVQKIVSAVMATGDILPIQPPGLNTSWRIEFPGPSLQCRDFEGEMLEKLKGNLHVAIEAAGLYSEYYAWLPRVGKNGSIPSYLPFPSVGTTYNLSTLDFERRLKFTAGQLVEDHPKPMTFYMAIMPGILTNIMRPTEKTLNNSTFLHCELFNSTYTVNFRYTNGIQDVGVRVHSVQTSQSLTTAYEVIGSVWDPESKSMVGCSPEVSDCYLNPHLFQKLAYQSLMDEFSSYVKGSIWQAPPDTRILGTVLDSTSDMALLERGLMKISAMDENLQSFVSTQKDPRVAGTAGEPPASSRSHMDIKTAMKELFQNITVSMMASSELR